METANDKNKKEKWIRYDCLTGECDLDNIRYDITNNSIEMKIVAYHPKKQRSESFYLTFHEVCAYRITLEHLRMVQPQAPTPPESFGTFFRVEDSSYIKWLENEGCQITYDGELDLVHYMLILDDHIVDVIVVKGTPVLINGEKLQLNPVKDILQELHDNKITEQEAEFSVKVLS